MQKSLWLKHNTTLCYSPVKPSSDIPGMVTLWGAPCQKNKYPGFSCLVTPVILWLQGLFGLIVCEVIQFSKVPFPVIFFSTIATACLPILSRLLWQSIRTLDLIVSLSSWKSFIVLPLCTKSRLLNRHEGSLRSGPRLSRHISCDSRTHTLCSHQTELLTVSWFLFPLVGFFAFAPVVHLAYEPPPTTATHIHTHTICLFSKLLILQFSAKVFPLGLP